MKTMKIGFASAALAVVACMSAPATAADLYYGNGNGGSVKDGGSMKDSGYQTPARPVASGPCYFRADTGYSWSREPHAGADADYTNNSLEDSWIGSVGVGCSFSAMPGRGFRADVQFGSEGSRKFEGDPTPADPAHTTIKSYTGLVNGYYDIGTFGGVTPYVGAGAGLAYHKMSDVYFTGYGAPVNRIEGKNDLSFAWALMAGASVQLNERFALDMGYRYLNMGSAESGRADNAGFINPALHIDDIAAHEFRVGLRYAFGASSPCCSYAPMK